MTRLLIGLAATVLAIGGIAAAAPVAAGDACDRAKLTGLWTSASYSIRIAGDGTYQAAGAPNMMTIDVTGRVAVDGCTLRFTDTGGSYACPASQVGAYTCPVSDKTLHLPLGSDDCDGRRLAVTDVTMTRTAR